MNELAYGLSRKVHYFRKIVQALSQYRNQKLGWRIIILKMKRKSALRPVSNQDFEDYPAFEADLQATVWIF